VDPHVGDHFLRLLGTAPNVFTSWHDRRITGTFGATPEERAASQDAATKAAAHSATPAVTHFDALGRACLSVVHNGFDAGVAQRFATRTVLDVENKPLAVIDMRERRVMEFCLREPAAGGGFRYVAGYDLAGNVLYRNGMDDGERRTLNNVVGKPARSFDARGFVFRTRYDALHRTTHRFAARAGGAEVLLERIVYGDKHPDLTRNLKGKVFRHYDAAGLAANERYDFKGNLTESARQFAQLNSPAVAAAFYQTTPDWSPINAIVDTPTLDVNAIDLATAPLLVNDDRFLTFSRFDALNRPIQIVAPHRATAPANQPSVVRPAYNKANLMKGIDVWIRQAAAPAVLLDPLTADIHAVTGVEYNQRGQRLSITHGNQVQVTYDYDRETFKLRTLTTTRPNTFAANERTVQELFYQYDPVGNVTRIRDTADIQNVVFFRNLRVEPSADYTYDALYRLTAATGREHLGQTGAALNAAVQPTNDDSPRTHSAPNVRFLNPGDGNAMGNYTERYEYDSAGNLMHMIHQVASGGWTRHYQCSETSLIDVTQQNNRLSANSLPGDAAAGPFSAPYTHDEHGNMIRMPHLPRLTYDADNRLQSTTRQVVAAGMPETTHYSYDSEGQRIRKMTFWQAAAGVTPNRKSERLYLGFFEIFREYDAGGNLIRERETLNVMDDRERLVVVETRTLGVDPGPRQLIRYQYTNQLSSAIVELDHTGDVISYEEYFPYGATSYQAVRSQVETPKRYRFTGKERDEENDLYYHGARYYAPWLGRWISSDKIEKTDSLNLYAYVNARPTILKDPTGHYGEAGHYYTVYFASLAAGFSPQVAQANAVFAQMPDEVNALDAFDQQVTSLSAPGGMVRWSESNRDLIQRGLHSLTGGSSATERAATSSALQKAEPGSMAFGFLLHRFGDTYAHSVRGNEGTVYETGFGHGRHGHTPDQIHERPELYRTYVRNLFSALSERARAQGLTPRLSEAQVDDFARRIGEIERTRTVRMHDPELPHLYQEWQVVDVEATESAQIATIRQLSRDFMRQTEFQESGIVGPPTAEQAAQRPVGLMSRYAPEDEDTMSYSDYQAAHLSFVGGTSWSLVVGAVHTAAGLVKQDRTDYPLLER